MPLRTGTYVLRGGRLVNKAKAAPREGGSFVSVISDTMNATWHPANGRHYDSKSNFRRATKDAGCVEIGSEKIIPRKFIPKLDKRQRGEDIKRAIHELQNR